MSFVGLLFRKPEENSTRPLCHAMTLGKGGTIIINDTLSITLDDNAAFKPQCSPQEHFQPGDPVTAFAEPFESSTSPQMYALAAATVISYLLLIILFITPRTFFVGGRGGGGANFLGRRGMISGSYGSSSVVGVGGRPWLQKVAALTVAVSLSIASSDTFRVAHRQYDDGYMDSTALTNEVMGGVELRVVRVISSTFLWLAQVQTLIRLFPRHKEKVIIKWAGFALIVLDTTFSILNNIVNRDGAAINRPSTAVDAIPALSYLFELSLSLLYAAWVIFYSLSKHRFAFFHPKMRNICLVALLSLSAILIPVVFFVLDVSKPDVAGWGEYIRWVGACAGSVVVWEWVERIEALEREEGKDGILGREIFDGDEMLEVTPSEEVDWPGPRPNGQNGGGGTGAGSGWGGVMGFSNRPLRSRVTFSNRLPQTRRRRGQGDSQVAAADGDSGDRQPVQPPQAVTPVSRADTTSAASTVYRVRYHSVSSPTQSSAELTADDDEMNEKISPTISRQTSNGNGGGYNSSTTNPTLRRGFNWSAVPNPFKRARCSPPTEVATAQAGCQGGGTDAHHAADNGNSEDKDGRWNFRSKLDGLLARRNWNWDTSSSDRPGSESILPVTVIPARTRGQRALSQSVPGPDVTQHSMAESQGHRSSETTLPVMVIPAQPRSRTWTTPNQEDAPAGDGGTQRADTQGSSPHGRTTPSSATSQNVSDAVHNDAISRKTFSRRDSTPVAVLREERVQVDPDIQSTARSPSNLSSPHPNSSTSPEHANQNRPIPGRVRSSPSYSVRFSSASPGQARPQSATAGRPPLTSSSPNPSGGRSSQGGDLEAQRGNLR